MVDVAFYTENVQALRSLERLDLNMPEIWEQKRWWRTSSPGQSGLSATPAVIATSSFLSEQEVKSAGGDSGLKVSFIHTSDSGAIQWRLTLRPPLSPVRTSTFSGAGRAREVPTSLLWRPNEDELVWLTNRSAAGKWSGDAYARSASFSTATTVRLSIHVQFCLLFNHCQMKWWMVIYLNGFGCWFIWFVFFPSKAFRILKWLRQCNDDLTVCLWIHVHLSSWMLN